ncbi:MAG: LysR family transcriptional regulator [Actinobacteria bacterium]|nr:LysR family transcriptional regulator [Actinomycetota bacterium]
MELRQLRYFIAVAEEGSFTVAARRLHVAQPGVSAQVRKLEEELGAPLLDRSDRAVRLTEAGTAVLAEARAAIAATEAAQGAVDDVVGLRRGRVRVGSVPSCPVADLPELLADFHRRFPEVEISLAEGNGEDLMRAIEAGRLDLAVVGTAGRGSDRFDRLELADEPLVVAAPPGHSLATVKSTTLSRLSEEPLICMSSGTGVRRGLELACAEQGLEVRVALEAGSPAIVARLAALGLGVAVLPESVAAAFGDSLRTIRFRGTAPRTRLELIWRDTSLSPAAEALVGHLTASLPGK